MITAEELIEEYKEHYETNRLEAIKMALEDLRLAETELVRLGAEEMAKAGKPREEGEGKDGS